MAGFGECLVSSLKEIYISLNTRMIREKFLRELIWELPAGEFLSEPHLDTYLRFVKSFYNEDIQSCLSNIGIKQIMDLILARFDRPNCCLAHAAKSSLDGLRGIDNYALVLSKYFSVVENILLLKRNNLDLPNLVGDIINMFSVSSSACFT